MQVYSTPGVSFPNGFPSVQGVESRTHLSMHTSSPRHITRAEAPPSPERVTEGFAHSLQEALRRVEAVDNEANELTRRAVFDPDSVDVHEVVIAAEKARFAINFTKTIADGVVRTYRELTNPR
ncbi:MAG: flagellar hook-basal body complex protein FliE [Spirochaetales bacterium]|nr:flagellar hook-basal body complex protein FliE [Spirochaetales bacterium]